MVRGKLHSNTTCSELLLDCGTFAVENLNFKEVPRISHNQYGNLSKPGYASGQCHPEVDMGSGAPP